MLQFAAWKDCDMWRWEHFSAKEMAQRGRDDAPDDRGAWERGETPLILVPAFMDRLELLRRKIGEALMVTSGYRSPAYNAAVSQSGSAGPHTTGRAVDIACDGVFAYRLVPLARELGFVGIGLRLHGASPFIHLDDLLGREWPRPRMWTYK